jgi:hypothetical protein
MAQLVFVHGVATRGTDEYKKAVANREKLFRELLFTGADVEIHSPMWGDTVPVIDAGVFATDKGAGTFNLNVGKPPGLGAGLAGNGATNGPSIVDVGKQDGVAALDAICSEIADQAARAGRDLREDELQAFRNAAKHIAANTAATLFSGNASQQSVVEQLAHGSPAAFSIGSLVGNAVSAVTDHVRNAASTLGFGAVRGSLSPAVGRFMGDVFVYLKAGPHRDQIRTVVREALLQAHAAKMAGKGPLVLVGHSMGGVILVDMLTDPPAAGLPADIAVDALLTVGSQPGLFASLDVLTPNVPPGSARRKPGCVTLWLNVFDPIDPLAFRADAVYKDVVDLVFNSVAGITDTHSKYFQRPQFYARARTRLQDAGLL